jgi:hypothetical protein
MGAATRYLLHCLLNVLLSLAKPIPVPENRNEQCYLCIDKVIEILFIDNPSYVALFGWNYMVNPDTIALVNHLNLLQRKRNCPVTVTVTERHDIW